jgi:hypothetical protein
VSAGNHGVPLSRDDPRRSDARRIRTSDLRGPVLPRAGSSFWPAAEYGAEAARAPGFPSARIRSLRVVWTRSDWQLVKGSKRVLRLLPLPPRLPCHDTNATLDGLFADELALLQPTPGYMRLLKESVLRIWKARKAAVHEEIATAERAAKPSRKARPSRRSVPIRALDRHRDVRPSRREIARGAHARASTVTQASSKNSTWRASWRSQNGFCRARPTFGSRPHSTSGSGSNNCSFRKDFPSTEIGLLEPAQLHRPSATCGRPRIEMKGWWT